MILYVLLFVYFIVRVTGGYWGRTFGAYWGLLG